LGRAPRAPRPPPAHLGCLGRQPAMPPPHGPVAGEGQREQPGLEITCVSLAKDQCKLASSPCFGEQGNRWRLLRLEHHTDEKAVATHLYNGVVCYAADANKFSKAERWMGKLDSSRGLEPSIEAFKALLRGATRNGDWSKAEEWFHRPSTPGLHPELGGLQPDGESYDIMVQAAASQGELVRAEQYLRLAYERGLKPARGSYARFAYSLLAAGEPRRAHHWVSELVRRGCSKVESYDPQVVKQELRNLRSQRSWPPEELVDLVLKLARCLATVGNPATANEWLRYLTECTVKPSDYPETWEAVRRATPPEIRAANLFSDFYYEQPGSDSGLPGTPIPTWQPASPAAFLPAALSGEERGPDGLSLRDARTAAATAAGRRSLTLHDAHEPCTAWASAAPLPRAASVASGTKRPKSRAVTSMSDAAESTRPPSSLSRPTTSLAASAPPSPPPPSLPVGGRGSRTARLSGAGGGYDESLHRPNTARIGRPAGASRGLRLLLEARRRVASADRAAVARRLPAGLARADEGLGDSGDVPGCEVEAA